MTRREYAEWLRNLPVEERVRLAFGEDDDGEAKGPLKTLEPVFINGPSGHRVIESPYCHVSGCDRPRKKGRLCMGHDKQKSRGTPFRPLRPHIHGPRACLRCGAMSASGQTVKGLCRRCYAAERYRNRRLGKHSGTDDARGIRSREENEAER